MIESVLTPRLMLELEEKDFNALVEAYHIICRHTDNFNTVDKMLSELSNMYEDPILNLIFSTKTIILFDNFIYNIAKIKGCSTYELINEKELFSNVVDKYVVFFKHLSHEIVSGNYLINSYSDITAFFIQSVVKSVEIKFLGFIKDSKEFCLPNVSVLDVFSLDFNVQDILYKLEAYTPNATILNLNLPYSKSSNRRDEIRLFFLEKYVESIKQIHIHDLFLTEAEIKALLGSKRIKNLDILDLSDCYLFYRERDIGSFYRAFNTECNFTVKNFVLYDPVEGSSKILKTLLGQSFFKNCIENLRFYELSTSESDLKELHSLLAKTSINKVYNNDVVVYECR
jgi:hypothetical protein